MNNAILLLEEMPKNCCYCPLAECLEEDVNHYVWKCSVLNKIVLALSIPKDNHCPLRELPDEKICKTAGLDDWNRNEGWNDCLSYIKNQDAVSLYDDVCVAWVGDESE